MAAALRENIPAHFRDLKNDPLRGIVGQAMLAAGLDSGHFVPFVEFHLADFITIELGIDLRNGSNRTAHKHVERVARMIRKESRVQKWLMEHAREEHRSTVQLALPKPSE